MLKIVSKGNFQSVDEFTFIDDKKLGSGSFGTVKLAIHSKTNRMYALKTINLADLSTESQVKLVQRQIKIHSEVDHPHIIKIWDTFIDLQKIYLVMQYAEMGNLFYHQNTKNVFTQAQAYKFFSQTVEAIKYLHNNDIIHRDLKVNRLVLQPQNLLLDQYLNIKICDFGWCAENCLVKRNTFCGTYEYMAPQMIFRTDYDYRVDIWALGILLYQLLHGIAPFKGKTIDEVQESMLKGYYQINPKLSENVKILIEQILQFRVDERLSLEGISQHSWMKEMENTIKQYMAQQKVSNPQQIHQKLSKMPISMSKLLSEKRISTQTKKIFHRKNNSMNLGEDSRNININLSINNFSIIRKNHKNKPIYHSQDKICSKDSQDFQQFKDGLDSKFTAFKFKKNSIKNQVRCKTLIDEERSSKLQKIQQNKKLFYKKISKDNFLQFPINQNTRNKCAKLDFNTIKKNLKLKKSQDKVEKPVRFNTEIYDKDEDSYLLKLKKNSKKSKIFSSTKNIKTSAFKAQI